MGIQSNPTHGGSQRYVDRMSQLLSSGSPEPNISGSPPTSIAGSVDYDCHFQQTDESDDERKATPVNEFSDEEETQEQRTEKPESVNWDRTRSIKSLNPEYPTECMLNMIECMAELDVRVQSNADSLTGQILWNREMQQRFADKTGAVDALKKEVTALRKQVEVLSSRDAVKNRESVGSKRQKQ
ncbi:hypothetical protein PENARI_c305G11139 [Penicillium arizonense]|uniref:Uncharacterized protein n=2 Tax=Penicillium arizonense TaxID=1835702 RepID=A0A1F5L010_PENAI|nr:hypothetical protein PENARI_c305G11139 [Penicillium arizonense]OGE46396.1 hypothetical protein PENARI_c305G11139 [Penicillium arizonense]